jgi:hypothetical protein
MRLNEFDPTLTESLAVGDPVIITGDVEFRGRTGDVQELGQDGSFVVVNLYNYGPQSFQASDVSHNDYADSEDDQDLAEVSKATIDRYITKASDAHGDADFAARMSKHDPDKRSYHVDQKKTAEKRRQGISRALDRMSRPQDVAEQERVGNMPADQFDAAMARLKKLAGAGPLKTVYDPAKRVYRNVPTAVQPLTQPKK